MLGWLDRQEKQSWSYRKKSYNRNTGQQTKDKSPNQTLITTSSFSLCMCTCARVCVCVCITFCSIQLPRPPNLNVISRLNGRYQWLSRSWMRVSIGLVNLLAGSEGHYNLFRMVDQGCSFQQVQDVYYYVYTTKQVVMFRQQQQTNCQEKYLHFQKPEKSCISTFQ